MLFLHQSLPQHSWIYLTGVAAHNEINVAAALITVCGTKAMHEEQLHYSFSTATLFYFVFLAILL